MARSFLILVLFERHTFVSLHLDPDLTSLAYKVSRKLFVATQHIGELSHKLFVPFTHWHYLR